ncbi:hypothetical protein AB0B66_37340 [Catellatospora sp. NPDC049111]|uniref:MOSC domain-containing protein n=1 Tax=Catellatospora sp. NPDC049111 TaxID=3155271 RepID=UPI0034116401
MFHGVGECARCAVATIDQDTGQQGREPLRTLAARRNVDQKLLFGLQLTVQSEPGEHSPEDRTISVGDIVEVLD